MGALGLTNGRLRPPAGHTCPLRPLTAVLPLMPPAPTPSLRAVVCQRGGGGPYTPAAAHRADSTLEAPHPIPGYHAASRVTQAPLLALGPPAAGSGPAPCLGCGHTDPNSAPAQPWPGVHAVASAPGIAQGAGASFAGVPAPRWLWPALHTRRRPAGHHTQADDDWRGGPPRK
jgi:hypothetical protein